MQSDSVTLSRRSFGALGIPQSPLPPMCVLSTPYPLLHKQSPIHFIIYCCYWMCSFLCFHTRQYCLSMASRKKLSAHILLARGLCSFFKNAIQITALNNRAAYIHWVPIKLLFFNSGNVSEIDRCTVHMLCTQTLLLLGSGRGWENGTKQFSDLSSPWWGLQTCT